MTMAGVSSISAVMPSAPEATPTPAPTSDGTTGFAATMAGVRQPGSAAPTGKGEDGKVGKTARASRDGRDDDKDRDRAATGDDGATAMQALLGLSVQPVPTDRTMAAADTGDGTQGIALAQADGRSPHTAPVVAAEADADASDAESTDGTTPPQGAQPATSTSAADLTPVLTALTASMGLTEQSGRHGDGTPRALPGEGAQVASPVADGKSGAPQQATGVPTAADAVQNPADTGALRPVSGVSDAASGQAANSPAPVAPPPPATAALLAARAGTVQSASRFETPAAAPHKASHEGDDDGDASTDADAGTPAANGIITLQATPTAAREGHSATTPAVADMAGQQLAAGAADRQLDLAKQGAWLDGLARDIASAGDSSGTLKFQVAPQNLGTVSVEVRRGDDGSAVTITASDETARAILSDAKPQLIAEVRAQGLNIANAQVDLGSSTSGSGGGQQPDSQQQQRGGSSHQPQNSGFSAQAEAGGGSGRQSQTRSQPLSDYRATTTRADRASTVDATASAGTASVPTRRTDARYA
jgi:flagellar hook-length control protein FliK